MELLSASARMTTGQRVALSIKAIFMGWLIFVVGLFLLASAQAVFSRYAWANGRNPFGVWLLIAYASSFVVFGSWLFVALPVALLIPDRSVLWRPAVLAALGAVAGPLLIFVCALYTVWHNPTIQPAWRYIASGIVFPGVPSAIIGGFTGAVAAHLYKKMRKP
jgi:hypothetical protein